MGDHEILYSRLSDVVRGRPLTIPTQRELWESGGTANFKAMAWAYRFARSVYDPSVGDSEKVAARTYALKLFTDQEKYGHQCMGGPGQCEQGCPDPHSQFHLVAVLVIRMAALDGHRIGIAQKAAAWLLSHVALLEAFRLPSGDIRMPCFRAKSDPAWSIERNFLRIVRARFSEFDYPIKANANKPSAWPDALYATRLLIRGERNGSYQPKTPSSDPVFGLLVRGGTAGDPPKLAFPIHRITQGSAWAAWIDQPAARQGDYIDPVSAVSSSGLFVRNWAAFGTSLLPGGYGHVKLDVETIGAGSAPPIPTGAPAPAKGNPVALKPGTGYTPIQTVTSWMTTDGALHTNSLHAERQLDSTKESVDARYGVGSGDRWKWTSGIDNENLPNVAGNALRDLFRKGQLGSVTEWDGNPTIQEEMDAGATGDPRVIAYFNAPSADPANAIPMDLPGQPCGIFEGEIDLGGGQIVRRLIRNTSPLCVPASGTPAAPPATPPSTPPSDPPKIDPIPPAQSPGASPLSPLDVRVEELRSLLASALANAQAPVWIRSIFIGGWALALKPFAIAALRLYRAIIKKMEA